ncbi:EAL domain-containing protein, partial [Citrobacter freundii]|uniref:EAL domain-containing protein n=1 Tax=Citrobacter freundii TaxID=546 RepID=UPI002407E76B
RDERQGKIPKASPITPEQIEIRELKKKLQRIEMDIDYIKIDQSFVGRVNELPDSTRILVCVLDLARKLSLSIVAEGVETKAQLDYLNKNNIVFLQGYYFYKPVTFTEFVMILLAKPKVKVFVE